MEGLWNSHISPVQSSALFHIGNGQHLNVFYKITGLSYIYTLCLSNTSRCHFLLTREKQMERVKEKRTLMENVISKFTRFSSRQSALTERKALSGL